MTYIIRKIEEYLGKKAKINKKAFHKADLKETWADITKANNGPVAEPLFLYKKF
jgi:hypothetical protein